MEWTDKSVPVRSLIRTVRLNPGLFAKGDKTYKDAEAKRLAWEILAFQIDSSCSGEMVSKRFKNIRDSFAKEDKIMRMEQPSGSAGGSMKTLIPSEFYYDLLFLKEHIGTRRSSTNIKRPTANTLDVFPQPTGETDSGTSTLVLDGSSTVQWMFSPTQDSTASDSDVNMDMSCSEDQTESRQPSPLPTVPSPGPTPRRSLHNSLIRAKALATFKSPPADMKSKRKNTEADEAAKALDRLNETARPIMDKVEAPDKEDGCIGMVRFALSMVPKQKLLACMRDIIKVAEIYQEGGTPSISDISEK